MDAYRFDALSRVLSTASPRRTLLGVLLALLGFLTRRDAEEAAARGRRKRRKKRHKHGKGNGRHRKGKRCRRKSRSRICANRCGIVKNRKTCKKKVNCGPCACGDVCVDGCRYATIQEAINDPDGPETIRLCAETYAQQALIDIQRSLTLIGAGAEQTILSGPATDRVLQIAEGMTVAVQGLTVTGGTGGITNAGNLTLRGVTVSGNTTTGRGGGIVNTGTLTLEGNTRIAGNHATNGGGGIFNSNGGTVTLQNGSRVSGNAATGVGGGIYNSRDSVLTLENGSQVAGNTADVWGGGIYNRLGSMVTLQNGSLVGGDTPGEANTAISGGGIFNLSGGTVTLENGSRVSGNAATDSSGGGIFTRDSGPVTLQNGSRVSGNTATEGGAGIHNSDGTVTVQADALVCDNDPGNAQCAGSGTFDGACPNPESGICPA